MRIAIARRAVQSLVAAAAFATLVSLAPRAALGQERGAAALDQLVRGLPVTARVLMIGAHPDDEDTNLLAWLARGHQVHAAYLSLTRGDGGQNLIGNELGESLGAIRTEELLAARRIDGAGQYFSRAFDFGFSKDAAETFRHWDREALTGDAVRVIRAFRPHVIVAVFTGTRADGHGHHEASGLIARDAYDVAGDTARFPVATHGRPWVPAKFYRSARRGGGADALGVEAGTYDAVLGRSPAEIAGESRSQHRSQGFGALQVRGRVRTAVRREATRVNEATEAAAEQSIFDGVDTSFARLGREVADAKFTLDSAQALIRSVDADLDLRRPWEVVPRLARLVQMLDLAVRFNGSADYAASVALAQVRAKRALLEAAGIAVEATASQELLAFGDSLPVRMRVHNRGRDTLTVISVLAVGAARARPAPVVVPPDSSVTIERRIGGIIDLRPWWIGDRNGGMFGDSRSPADGLALVSYGNPEGLVPSVSVAEGSRRVTDVRLEMWLAGTGTEVTAGPINWRYADPVLGEQSRPLGGVPPVTVSLDRGLEYVPADRPLDRRVRVTVQSHAEAARVLKPKLLLPAGLRAEGVPDSLVLAAGETRELDLVLKGRLPAARHEFGIGFTAGGTLFAEGFRTIEYPHIRPQRMYRSSAMYLQAVSVSVPSPLAVAYVTGVSDASASALQQLGVQVAVVSPAQLPLLDLSRYTTVVIGPRAYEVSPELRAYNERLMAWVRGGGTLVVQYGQYEMTEPGMMPFPVGLSRPAARVTLEDAEVRVIDPSSRLLIWPNRIIDDDWKTWVQERGLYMPSEIDPRYRTPLAMNDPGEPENRGAILDATVGKGRYIYTSLSLFRQVPGGVPGGVRLLLNLVSAGLESTP